MFEMAFSKLEERQTDPSRKNMNKWTIEDEVCLVGQVENYSGMHGRLSQLTYITGYIVYQFINLPSHFQFVPYQNK